MTDSARWLLNNRIDHVLWLKTEGKLAAGTWDRIQSQVRHAYFWREGTYRADEFRVGVWSRYVDAAAAAVAHQRQTRSWWAVGDHAPGTARQ